MDTMMKKPMKKQKIYLLALAFCLVFAHTGSALALQMVSIDGDNVNMRSGPGKKNKVIWKLGNGYPLKILKQSGHWLRVQDFEGSIGWVHKQVTKREGHMIVKVHKNSKSRINIRSGPGRNKRIVAKAYYGVVFKTLEQRSGWVKVRHGKRVTGWIKRSLVWGF